jgi:hypothetical protein
MQKVALVEETKQLFRDAQGWSIWRWLTEKRRVRGAADAATEALEKAEKKVKAGWSNELKQAYKELRAHSRNGASGAAGDQIHAAVKRVKEADDEAYAARMKAEETFDLAERRLSTSMAKEGALQAIEAYELRERAIRRAEAAARIQQKNDQEAAQGG